MKYSSGWIFLLFISVLLSSGCTSKKAISIPPDWKSAPPVSRSPSPVPPRIKAPAPLPPPVQSAPILKPPPAFTEKDLPANSESAASPPVKKPTPPPPPPQQMASMHLVDQGKAALAHGKPDAAISVLEQAIQVDVYNGEAFLLLARAWKMKASRNKAMEFARKAEVLFHEDKGKLKEVYLFQADLYKDMGDASKAEQCRQKASKL